jgi:carboxymethylenebutenolidase
LFATLDQRKCREDFVDALEVLRAHPRCHGKVGVIGFCYGGRIANLLATRVPDLGAAVPFYGAEPPLEDVPRIQAPLQIHLADHDERINAGWPAYQAALETARIPYEIHHYPGTEHGFNNNTTPRFDPAAAERAWGRSVAFLRARLV